jgi:DNA repair photolyase
MDTITRKSLLNRSALGFFCVNHVQGCAHGCLYPCYAFCMARSYGRCTDYEDWRHPRLVANAAELLAKELGRPRRRPDSVHLCLTTDPFMKGWPEVTRMSLELIALINSKGIPASVLTKGTLPGELADRTLFPEDNVYGISLVSLSENFRRRWEPGAAPYAERIEALRRLHDKGRSTLVHIEPYPTPNLAEQDLTEILEEVAFVDSIYFSGWNYNALARQYARREEYYRRQARIVRRFCREKGIRCAGAG